MAVPPAPVIGEHRSSRLKQIGPNLLPRTWKAKPPERGDEDFLRQVLCIRPVADSSVDVSIDPGEVVPVDRFPVGILLAVQYLQTAGAARVHRPIATRRCYMVGEATPTLAAALPSTIR
jgi:hypothetical protein